MKYGEPWTVDIQGCDLLLLSSDGICTEVCHEIVNQYGTDTLEVNRFRRIASCVNACSSMPDPASEIEAMRKVITTSKQFHAAVYYWFEGMNEGVSDHEMQVRKAALGVIEDQYHAALSEYHKIKGGTDGKVEG